VEQQGIMKGKFFITRNYATPNRGSLFEF